ncbi:MAG: cytochrome c3 family protein [Bacillota bacterium]
MKRIRSCFVFTMVLCSVLIPAAAAFAWTHGQFSATTDACGGCHVAHAAQLPKLLKAGPTQTQFCFLCHGDGCSGAPYDVKDGYTAEGVSKVRSIAGGFVNTWNGVAFVPVTSRHNVWGLVGETGDTIDENTIQLFIPGGTNVFTGSGFVCSSCHDPHAGGKVRGTVSWKPPGSNSTYSITQAMMGNPRLMRTSIFGQTTDSVIFRFRTVGNFTTSSGVYQVTAYIYGSTSWCGACHNIFDTSTCGGDRMPEGGHAAERLGMWRHPMDVHTLAPSGPGMGGYGQIGYMGLIDGTPLELWNYSAAVALTRKVACLSCHYAHSTTAVMNGWAASWPRDSGAPTSTGNTSALLRMNSRGICYNCHGAAQYNCWNDPRIDCTPCHTSPLHTGDCDLCH